MMNAGGYRVSPIEVEQAFASMEGIIALAATQIEVKADTFVIAAFYTGPVALDDTTLKAHAVEQLAHYKRPRLYLHIDALPLGANGKVLRKVLRDSYDNSAK
jgi:acyl-coenzyme A synthetase/AMP-(fatty) acid ligase